MNVPVSAAYNQWTQFEDFLLFMEGADHVQQKDDTRLHRVATVGGKMNEWDAKILEQHPDKQISWISEDGKKTRGTVSFEPVGESRTRISPSMSYQAEGLTEALSSAAGLDQRRVRGYLERFKDLSRAAARVVRGTVRFQRGRLVKEHVCVRACLCASAKDPWSCADASLSVETSGRQS